MACGLVHWCPSPEPATTLHDVCVDVRVCVRACVCLRLGILRDHPLKAELLEELEVLQGTSVTDLMGLMGVEKASPIGIKRPREIPIEDVDSPRKAPAPTTCSRPHTR